MTSYTIIVSCPELSLTKTLFTFDLPEIKFDGVVKNTELVTAIYDQLAKVNITNTKSALLSVLQAMI